MTIADIVKYLQSLPQDAQVFKIGRSGITAGQIMPCTELESLGGMIPIERGIYGPHAQAAAFTGEWREKGRVVRSENLERVEYRAGFLLRG